MDVMKRLEAVAEKIVMDPAYHDVLSLVKGLRNGIIYGCRVRFPHALVIMLLFRSGTLRHRLLLVLHATRQHARNLGLFAIIYKASMILFRSARGKEGRFDTFMSGLVGGYCVFGRGQQSSVSQQIVIYVFARVMLASAKLLIKPPGAHSAAGAPGGWGLVKEEGNRKWVQEHAWPAFASLSWAFVMYIFRWHPETVQSSLRSSMQYIYVDSDHWDSLDTFLWRNQ